MNKTIIILLALCLLTGICYAKQEYNLYEDRWETVPDNSDWTPQYNPYENDWSYQPDNANIEYNLYENSWDWDSGKNPQDSSNEFWD